MRKTRNVLTDVERRAAAYQYRNASDKQKILKQWNISRGAMSGWLTKGYGLEEPRRVARGTQPPPEAIGRMQTHAAQLRLNTLEAVQSNEITVSAAQRLLEAIRESYLVQPE